jgi:hypothetical protein
VVHELWFRFQAQVPVSGKEVRDAASQANDQMKTGGEAAHRPLHPAASLAQGLSLIG